MAGKKYLVLLGILAVVSFGASLAVSLLLGEPKARPPAQGKPLSQSDALLAHLAAASAGQERPQPGQKMVEELVKDLRARVAEYERKQQKLEEHEKRLALAEENLVRRAKELETLRMELVGPLTRLKDAMAELDRSRVLVARQEKVNLQRIAGTYEKMDTAAGGKILSEMCANEQTDDVVKILYYMDERSAAKVLAEIPDQALAARLTALMQKVKEEG